MISDDLRAAPEERLNFVLHLGDFIYELVWYPEERAEMYDRRIRDILRYPHGEKIDDFHIPTTPEDYRLVHREPVEHRLHTLVDPRAAVVRALLTPTSTTTLRTMTPLRLITNRDKRMLAPFIGLSRAVVLRFRYR